MVLSEKVQWIRDPQYGGVWDDFRPRLKKLGYLSGTRVVCTSNWYRRRLILCAIPRQLARAEFLVGEAGDEAIAPEADPENVVQSVRAAIGGLPQLGARENDLSVANHRKRNLSELNLKGSAAKPSVSDFYMKDTPDGDPSPACHRNVNAKLQTRMSSDRTFPTITTKYVSASISNANENVASASCDG